MFPATSHNQRLAPLGLNTTPSANNVVIGVVSTTWYPEFLNTGATAHIVNTGKNIIFSMNYSENDSVFTANGKSMKIIKVGQSAMSCLILKEILSVKEATRNLLSIQKLCTDNKVCVKFDEQRVTIHDLLTNEVLKEEKVRNELYPVQQNKDHQALTAKV